MKYSVYGYLTISCWKQIEASSESEAREKANCLDVPGLCHQCSSAGSGDSELWELNGFDSPPDDCIQEIIYQGDVPSQE